MVVCAGALARVLRAELGVRNVLADEQFSLSLTRRHARRWLALLTLSGQLAA